MTLREQLAKRLEDVGRARYFMTNDNAPAPSGLSLDLADECIRQMRYAAYEWAEDTYPGSGEHIAPDDYDPYRRFPDQSPK